MHAAELTPIERGALLVLMAEGRPLKERAELKGIHGIALEASHRSKLQRLGLIQTTKKPFTHSLSEEGWQWARKEIGAPKPKGVMGTGALYSVLGGLRRYIDRHGIGLEGVFCAAEPTVTDGLISGSISAKLPGARRTKRSGTVSIVNARGSQSGTSSQVSGVETRASGTARTE